MTVAELSFEEVHNIAQDIEGWLSVNEAKLLYDLASSSTGKGAIVEIGSWCGKSLIYEAFAALGNNFQNKIISIDPYLTSVDEPNGKYETFVSNLKANGIFEKITHIKEKSQVAGVKFSEPIEFIFVDGFHKYEAVKQDFELYFPKIIENGFMAIHDVFYFQGPTDLVMELAQNNLVKIVDMVDSIALIQKVEKLNESDMENNKRILDFINSQVGNFNLIQ